MSSPTAAVATRRQTLCRWRSRTAGRPCSVIWGKQAVVAAFTEFRRCLQAEEAHAPAVEPPDEASEASPNSSQTLGTASSLLQTPSPQPDGKPLLPVVLPGRILCSVRPEADARGGSASSASASSLIRDPL